MPTARFNPPPGWPTPPDGWVPDPQWQPDPSWPPVPPGWQWWATEPSVGYGAEWPTGPQSPPRSQAVRVLLTILIVLTPVVPFFLIAAAIGLAIDPANYPTELAYHQAVGGAVFAAELLYGLGCCVVDAILARKVGYSWSDSFAQVIPVYGLIWQIRVAYRLAHLPHRGWAESDDVLYRRRVVGGA